MHTTNVASGILRSALVAGSLITITALAACSCLLMSSGGSVRLAGSPLEQA